MSTNKNAISNAIQFKDFLNCDDFKFYDAFVTGAQCSGTRIASKIIAKETGKTYVDEKEYDTHDEQKFKDLISNNRKNNLACVYHCSSMCHVVYKISSAVVFMMFRDMEEIRLSQEKIGWKKREIMRLNYLNT